jgi:1,4-alpha-glucan branching enzyme
MATLEKRGPNQWRVKIRRRGFPLQTRTFETKATAIRYARRIEREMDSGAWRELLNSDAACYGGGGCGNLGRAIAAGPPCHDRPHSVDLTLPPLGVIFLKQV